MNRQPTGLDQMNYYRENSVIRHGIDPKEVNIGLNGKIIVGKFIDIDHPTYADLQNETNERAFGSGEARGGPAKKEKAAAASASR